MAVHLWKGIAVRREISRILFIAPVHAVAHEKLDEFAKDYGGLSRAEHRRGKFSSAEFGDGLSAYAFDSKIDTINDWFWMYNSQAVIVAVDWKFWPGYTRWVTYRKEGGGVFKEDEGLEELFEEGLLERNRDGKLQGL